MLPVSRCVHKTCTQQLYYIVDSSKLSQTCDDVHFMWKDIQLSKGQLNKKRLISAAIISREKGGDLLQLCSMFVCKSMPTHEIVIMLYLSVTSNAAQNTTYPCKGLVNAQLSLYMSIPKILMIKGGLLRCQKDPSDNLHNHLLHGATKISQCIKSKIDSAVTADPSLTPYSDIASGKGPGFLPAAVDGASCHSGKVSLIIKKAKERKGLMEKY